MPKTAAEIESLALLIADKLKFTKRRRKKCDEGLEKLFNLGVTLVPIDDDEWLYLTRGHFDPSNLTITVPNKIYENACKGEKDALFVMLHELGHLFLLHQPLHHFSNTPATKEEDAEWQADTFAETILAAMGYEMKQLSFDFYM